MRGPSDQLGSYLDVTKKLLNKATTEILLGMLRTQELPFGVGGLSVSLSYLCLNFCKALTFKRFKRK